MCLNVVATSVEHLLIAHFIIHHQTRRVEGFISSSLEPTMGQGYWTWASWCLDVSVLLSSFHVSVFLAVCLEEARCCHV